VMERSGCFDLETRLFRDPKNERASPLRVIFGDNFTTAVVERPRQSADADRSPEVRENGPNILRECNSEPEKSKGPRAQRRRNRGEMFALVLLPVVTVYYEDPRVPVISCTLG
jgi:hypothetical protein